MTTKNLITNDVTRTTLSVLFIGILTAASFWILRPFLTSLVWATIIVVATWPLFLRLQVLLWNRRGLAVGVMTALLLMLIVAPLIFAIIAIVGKAGDIAARVEALSVFTVSPPPDWINHIPLVGRMLGERWQQVAGLSHEELAAEIIPYAETALRWFAAQAGGIATVIIQFLLTVLMAAIIFTRGEAAAEAVRIFARRLAGERGDAAAVLAAKAVRGVALGIVVTAIVQAGIGGIGLAVSGVPAAMLLTAVMLILSIAQLGPLPVLIPAIIYLFWSGQPLLGSVLIVVSIIAGTIDSVIRPFLIRKGADLPLLLIFAGVIGGLMVFGVIGIFIGPVVLAVMLTLLQAWLEDNEQHKAVASEGE